MHVFTTTERVSLFYKILTLTALVVLAGCAKETAANFTPFTVEIVSKQALAQDLDICRRYAGDYLSGRSSIDASQVAQEGARAGLGSLGYLPLAATAPALGALGGASGEALSELGLDSQEAKKVVTICLHDKGQKTDMYHVYDPNN